LKQLKKLLVFISCIFFLPALQGENSFNATSSDYIFQVYHHAAVNTGHVSNAHALTDVHYLKDGPARYRYRTRALNDYHEPFLFVSSIRIRSLFVYIHPQYKGYKESYISVAVTLSDWRGPPVA